MGDRSVAFHRETPPAEALVTQMRSPSKAAAKAPFRPLPVNCASTVPRGTVPVDPPTLRTTNILSPQGIHRFVPSKTGWRTVPLKGIVCRTAALVVSTRLSELSPASATHRFAPSKRMPRGWLNPVVNVATEPIPFDLEIEPVPGPLPSFAVHRFCPSNVIPTGLSPM